MKITWLGESGFLLEDGAHTLLLDPYFSDALGQRQEDRHRLRPVDPAWLQRDYDLVLLTHCHIDHTDPETLRALQARQPRLMLAGPPSSREALGPCPCWFDLLQGAQIRLGTFHIRALPAIHSDPYALGYEIIHQGNILYFSGDTALLCGLAQRVPQAPDAAFLCFNGGAGKNMDVADAARLAGLIGAQRVIPFHYGLLPGGPEPQALATLLKTQGIPCRIPGYGETFTLEEK